MATQTRMIEVKVAGYRASITHYPGGRSEAPTILALHGFTGSGKDFLPLCRCPGLDRFNWLCLDFMGHGNSDSPDFLDPYLLVNALQLIDEARAASSAPDKVCLLGYSMGARIALHYLKWAKPLPAVLIAANPGIDKTEDRLKRRKSDARLIPSPHTPISDFCEKWEKQDLIRPQTRLPEPINSQLAARRRRNSPTGLRNTLLALGSGVLPSLWPDLAKLPAALCLYGQHDGKFEKIAMSMQNRNSFLEAVPIPECGHAPQLENPVATATVLSDFMDSLPV